MKKSTYSGKLLMIAISCILIFSMLSGCGGTNGSTTTGTDNITASKPAETGTATEITQSKASPKDISATIDIWTWEQLQDSQKIIEEFNKEYPNIKVQYTNVLNTDMPKKIQTALAANSDLPDIAWMESQVRGVLINMDCWEDLSTYGIEKSSILDFMIPLSTNSKGELVGIEVSPAFAGLAYKRDLAKQYFGTDDPDELEKLIPDWDAFLKMGQEVNEKSGGKVFMMTGIDEIFGLMASQNSTPVIDGNKLLLKSAVLPTLNKLIDFTKAGIVDKLSQFTPSWNAAFAQSNHIFNTCATWAPNYVIKPNDKNGSGRWGLMVPPGGAVLYGGTIVGVPKKAKNKEAAIEYIKWSYLSEAGAKAHRDYKGYFSTMKSIYEDKDFYSMPDPFFGGQDIFRDFALSIAPNVAIPRAITKYDQDINSALSIAVATINSSKDGNISADELIGKVEDTIREHVPNLQKE